MCGTIKICIFLKLQYMSSNNTFKLDKCTLTTELDKN